VISFVQQTTIERDSQMQTPTVDKAQQKIKDDKFHQQSVVVLPDSGEQLNIAGSQFFTKLGAAPQIVLFLLWSLLHLREKV
jgi:hypothetical protein